MIDKEYEETMKWLEELGLVNQPATFPPAPEPTPDGSIHCINPGCYSEKEYAKQFGEEYAEMYPLFRYKIRGRQLWFECVQCGAEFRPSKTLNGVHLNGGQEDE